MRINNKKIEIVNGELCNVIKKYMFLKVSKNDDVPNNENIKQSVKDSKFILINLYTEPNSDQTPYLIIGFKQTIIIIKKSLYSLLDNLFSPREKYIIYSLCEITDIKIDHQLNEKDDNNFFEEIKKFNDNLKLKQTCNTDLKEMWKFIIPCISGYLIKESYEKTKINRIEQLIKYEEQETTKANNNNNKNNNNNNNNKNNNNNNNNNNSNKNNNNNNDNNNNDNNNNNNNNNSNNNNNNDNNKIIDEKELIELRIIGTGSCFRVFCFIILEMKNW